MSERASERRLDEKLSRRGRPPVSASASTRTRCEPDRGYLKRPSARVEDSSARVEKRSSARVGASSPRRARAAARGPASPRAFPRTPARPEAPRTFSAAAPPRRRTRGRQPEQRRPAATAARTPAARRPTSPPAASGAGTTTRRRSPPTPRAAPRATSRRRRSRTPCRSSRRSRRRRPPRGPGAAPAGRPRSRPDMHWVGSLFELRRPCGTRSLFEHWDVLLGIPVCHEQVVDNPWFCSNGSKLNSLPPTQRRPPRRGESQSRAKRLRGGRTRAADVSLCGATSRPRPPTPT